MTTILVDHNIEGQAGLIWDTLSKEGWLKLFSIQLITLEQVGLPYESNDREIWRFAQKNKMVLLTANRRMKGEDNLEQVIREENTEKSLPVITISNAN